MEFMLSMGAQICRSEAKNDTCLEPEESDLAADGLNQPSGVLWQFMPSQYEDTSAENQFYMSMGTLEDDNPRHHDTFRDDCVHCLEAKMREKRAHKGAATKARPMVTANLDCALVSELDINNTKTDLAMVLPDSGWAEFKALSLSLIHI